MAFGKNSRVDSRRSSSSYCSVITVVLFVALCLVGVWMMTSSSIVPGQNVDLSSSVTKSELNPKVVESDSRQFEDSSGDVPDDGMKEDIESHTNPTQEENSSVVSGNKKKTEYPVEENKVENISQDGEEIKNVAKDTSKRETQNDGERKADGEGGEMGTEERDTNTANGEKNETGEEEDREKESEGEKKSDAGENSSETGKDDKVEEVDQNHGLKSEQNPGEAKIEDQAKDGSSTEVFPDGAQSEILNETTTQNGAFLTQALESKNEKEAQEASKSKVASYGYNWNLCNVVAGPDYIPCLDNEVAIRKLPSTRHYEHRERHCPEEGPTCLVPLPEGYKQPIQWPNSRDKIWYHNVPHTKLAAIKGHQNWVKVTGEYLTFPGGGTQFKNGALHYIDFIQESLPDIAWGKRSRLVLDVGCGVASFGGYLFERDVLTLSFAPKDEHEAQVQFALERGIPAISAVMGTKRLPFPGRVFDIVHCARCRVPWHIEGGKLLLELNRVLRPGGYFVWSATPVYRKGPEDAGIWDAMLALTKSMCWELLTINEDKVNEVGAAIFKKPTDNNCYKGRSENNPPLCPAKDDPNAAWNIPLEACLHRVPEGTTERGSQWPEQWPLRLEKTPYWLNDSQIGVYGRPAPEDFTSDYKHWKRVVSKSYLKGMGISWSNVRNVMDMRSVYGGFAAALRDMKVWVMNVVSIDAPDTLPLIYERGLFGMYHDWCESFSTYPRTYDLIHADHLFSKIKKRCKLTSVIAEVDRILRPEGKLIVRDNAETINEIENMVKSLQWEIRMTFSKDKEGLLCVQKSYWRPQQIEAGTNSSSMA